MEDWEAIPDWRTQDSDMQRGILDWTLNQKKVIGGL